MKRITAKEFEKLVEENPAWATTLTEPVEIDGYCYLHQSPITHLSPLLHFAGSGLDDDIDVAKFHKCRHLRVAEGTFHGCVNFESSSIEKIGKLTVTKPSCYGNAASFAKCTWLKVAEGTYPGYVDFDDAGIIEIGNLVITAPNENGISADFCHCFELKIARGTYTGLVRFQYSGVEKKWRPRHHKTER
jgi:hypothetical protein